MRVFERALPAESLFGGALTLLKNATDALLEQRIDPGFDGSGTGSAESSALLELRDLVRSRQQPIARCRHRPASELRGREALEGLLAQVVAVGERAAHELFSFLTRDFGPYATALDYHDRVHGIQGTGEHVEEAPCTYCGGRILVKGYRVGLVPERHRRMLQCDGCGFLGDVPSDLPVPTMTGPTTVEPERVHEYRVRGRNAGEHHAFVLMDLHPVVPAHAPGALLVEPTRAALLSAPGESFETVFTLEATRHLPPQWYNLRLLASLNGEPACVCRQVLVRRPGP